MLLSWKMVNYQENQMHLLEPKSSEKYIRFVKEKNPFCYS